MFNADVQNFIEMCQWDSARFLIFSENVFGPFIYYSHLLPLFASILLTGFIFFQNRKNIAVKWLTITVLLLSIWLFSDLVLWATEKPEYTMFFWSVVNMIEPMIYVGMLFFAYALIGKRDIPFKGKILVFALLLPTILLAPTRYALLHYDLSNCYREAIEGPLAFYGYGIEIIFSIWILGFGVREFVKEKVTEERKRIALAILGIMFFLLSFAMGNVIGSYLVDWVVGQYGLFGIPVFLALLAYLIVRYKAFNIKVFGAQMLVAAMWIALLSLMFVRTIENVRIIVPLTLALILIAGIMLVRGVKQEVLRKEELQKSTEELYSKNFEIVVKNKTAALLEKLYKTGTLTLAPEEMAKELSSTIRQDLNLECAGILRLRKKDDSLFMLGFSGSDRLKGALHGAGVSLEKVKVSGVSKNVFLAQATRGQDHKVASGLQEVFGSVITKESLQKVNEQSNIKSVLIAPLNIGRETLGILLLGFNREYNDLSSFERESIRNFTDPIALMLYKAYLYRSLQKAYAVERHAKEELENLDKAKDQFLIIAQHNLRSPLTAMMGYAELLLAGDFGKQNKKTIEVIKKFQILAQGMKRMANDYLDVAKFQLGKAVVSLTSDVEVVSVLDEIVGELVFTAKLKGISLEMEKPAKGFVVKADREKLKGALFNIIENAVKYTEKGGVTVAVKDGKRARIVISDTGIGIPKEKIKDLFVTQFQRGENAQKVFAGGHGIGLYLAGQIIKAHNGKIWAESDGQGKGATFYIELPV